MATTPLQLSDTTWGNLTRTHGAGRTDAFAKMLQLIWDDVCASGFTPGGQLTGGIAGVAVKGRYRGRDVVAKLSPGVLELENQADALEQWEGLGTPRLIDRGPGWYVADYVGEPAQVTERDWPEQLALLRRLHTVTADEQVDVGLHAGLIRAARSRPASVEFLGQSQLDTLQAAAEQLDNICDGEPSVLCHGDPHDGNWLRSHGRLWLIDPYAHSATAEADIARWTLAGGADAQRRAQAALESAHWDPRLLAVWTAFLAYERVAALVHHGRSVHWGQQRLAAGLAAADVFRAPR